MRKDFRQLSGFTLIELLVTISIMAVLFGIVITAASSASKNSRDAQRLSDLRSIQQALQHYYIDQNYFPSSAVAGTSLASITEIDGCPSIGCSGTPKYLTTMPKDSVFNSSSPYCYLATANNTGGSCDNTSSGGFCKYYTLVAKMENPTISTTTLACGGTTYAVVSGKHYEYKIGPLGPLQ